MTFEYEEFFFVVIMILGIIFISLVILFAVQIVYSQDVDPNAYCLYNNTYPFNELCKEQQKHNTLVEILNETQDQWNNNYK